MKLRMLLSFLALNVVVSAAVAIFVTSSSLEAWVLAARPSARAVTPVAWKTPAACRYQVVLGSRPGVNRACLVVDTAEPARVLHDSAEFTESDSGALFRATRDATAWLAARHPRFADPAAYWDDAPTGRGNGPDGRYRPLGGPEVLRKLQVAAQSR